MWFNEGTIFEYENQIGKITFAYDSPFWITDINGVSGPRVDIAQSQGSGQVGSSVTNASILPREPTIDGCIRDAIGFNREKLIEVLAPQVPSALTVKEGAESWCMDVQPIELEIAPGTGEQPFQLKLHAAYPNWKSTQAYATMVAGLVPLFTFPFYSGGKWKIAQFSEDYFVPIYNSGNMPIQIKVKFTARSALRNPELLHVESGKLIRINHDMQAGEQIIVSTIYGERGCVFIDLQGKASKQFKMISKASDLTMAILPGDNEFRADATPRSGLGVHIYHPEGERSGV